MAKKVYGLTKKDRDLVQSVISRMGAGKGVLSKRPPPTRRRGRSGGGSSLRWGEAIGVVNASTGRAAADAGTGSVQFYDADGVEDGDPVAFVNKHPSEYPDGASLYIDRSKSPYELIYATCATIPAEEEE